MSAKIYIVFGGSGVGKTTLINKLVSSDLNLNRIVTYTSRKPRVNEVANKDYFFLSEADFKDKIEKNFFLEFSNAYGNWYGTSKKSFSDNNDKILILDINGVKKLAELFSNIIVINLIASQDILKERIILRGSIDDLDYRLALVEQEAKALINIKNIDILVLNVDLLEDVYQKVYNLIKNK